MLNVGIGAAIFKIWMELGGAMRAAARARIALAIRASE
jgi:hypothetical protein